MIAALFVERNGPYYGIPYVDPWDESRDAGIIHQNSRQGGVLEKSAQRRRR
jgi:hypothetical protein